MLRHVLHPLEIPGSEAYQMWQWKQQRHAYFLHQRAALLHTPFSP